MTTRQNGIDGTYCQACGCFVAIGASHPCSADEWTRDRRKLREQYAGLAMAALIGRPPDPAMIALGWDDLPTQAVAFADRLIEELDAPPPDGSTLMQALHEAMIAEAERTGLNNPPPPPSTKPELPNPYPCVVIPEGAAVELAAVKR